MSNCQNEIDDDALFCQECGVNIKEMQLQIDEERKKELEEEGILKREKYLEAIQMMKEQNDLEKMQQEEQYMYEKQDEGGYYSMNPSYSPFERHVISILQNQEECQKTIRNILIFYLILTLLPIILKLIMGASLYSILS